MQINGNGPGFQAPKSPLTPPISQGDATPVDAVVSACPFLRAQQNLQAVSQAVKAEPKHVIAPLAQTGAETAADVSASLTPSTLTLARSLGLRFQAPARFANFAGSLVGRPATRWKNVSPESAIEKAVKHRPLRVKPAGGVEWLNVESLESLQGMIADAQREARKAGYMHAGMAAATQAAASLSPLGGLWNLGSSPTSQTGPQTQKLGLLPFLRGATRFSKAPVSFLQEFHAKHGPSFEVKVPGKKPFLFDTRREVLMDALKATDQGSDTWAKSKVQGHGATFLIGEKNMFLSNGEDWNSIHEAVKPHLAGKVTMSDAMSNELTDIFDEHLADLKGRVEAAPGGKLEIDPRREIQGAVLDVAFRVFMGVKLPPAELKDVQNAFNTQMKWLTMESVNPTNTSISELPGFDKLRGAYDTLNSVADRMVAERKAAIAKGEPVSDDMLSTFIKTVDPATGKPFDDERLRHEVLSLLEAGHETTATMIGWSLTMLSRHPEAQEKLHQEVDQAFAGARPPSSKSVRSLTQPENIMQETLRMFPAFYLFMREAKEDTTIGPAEAPVQVKKGTTLVTSLYEQQRDEKTWGVEATGYPAHEFRPERFDGKTPALLSFGAGKRGCIGQAMGRLEIQLMLTRFSQQFQVDAAHHEAIGVGSDLSIHPTNGNVMVSVRKCPAMQGQSKE